MCFSNCLLFNLLTMFFLTFEYPALPDISSLPPVQPPAQTQDLPEQPRRQCRPHSHAPPPAISKPNSTIPGHCSQTTMREFERWRESLPSVMLLEVRLLRQLVEKTSGDRGSELGAASDYSDNVDIARSIRTIVPHESESVEEGNGDQMARKHQHQRDEEEDEERSRRAELARLWTPVETHRQSLCYQSII
jgi:hypothetical protein